MQFTGNCHVSAHVTMVLCVVVGCNDHSDSGSNKGISFYRIPAVTDGEGKADYGLRKLQREGYLATTNRKNLDFQQLDKYRICERHFVSGSPTNFLGMRLANLPLAQRTE